MIFGVNNTTLLSPLDLIAPLSCRGCGHLGEPLCGRCKNNIIKPKTNICPRCKKPKTSPLCNGCKDLPPIYSLGIREGLLGILIHDYKYNSTRALANTFCDLLDASLPKLPKDTVIVPLPTARHHIRARALDHTAKIAKLLAKKRHFKTARVLLRIKDTVQVGSDRATRLRQAKEAYTINPKITINPTTTYLLLDDVWTTGATLLSATKKLREAGALNIGIAVLAISN